MQGELSKKGFSAISMRQPTYLKCKSRGIGFDIVVASNP